MTMPTPNFQHTYGVSLITTLSVYLALQTMSINTLTEVLQQYMWQIISLCVYMTYELRRPQSYDFNIILKFCFSLSSDKFIWSALRFFISSDFDFPNLEYKKPGSWHKLNFELF